MIVAQITSGLGNQLFQYALARHLSVINNTTLYFDTRFYESDYAHESQRSFKLHNFNIEYYTPRMPLLYALKSTRLLPGRTLKPFFIHLKENHYHFDPEILNTRGLVITQSGYWHSEKYFEPIADIVRKELTFTNKHCIEFDLYRSAILNTESSVSIHIRRGDYVNHPEFSKTFGFTGLVYYQRAMSFIKMKVSNPKFFLFTDDKEWVKANFDTGEDHFHYVEVTGPDADLDDLHLMSLCKHNIIANSSYSWWGAWLNSNKNKIVAAPANWFKNQPTWDTKDLLPESWTRI